MRPPVLRARLLGVCVSALVAACTSPPPTADRPGAVHVLSGGAPDDPLNAVRAGWLAAHNSGDGAALAAYFAEDAVILPSGGTVVRGRPAIREYLTSDFESGVSTVSILSSRVHVSGDMAVEWAEYEARPNGAPDAPGRRGKYVIEYRRSSDGTWLIQLDTWNSDSSP